MIGTDRYYCVRNGSFFFQGPPSSSCLHQSLTYNLSKCIEKNKNNGHHKKSAEKSHKKPISSVFSTVLYSIRWFQGFEREHPCLVERRASLLTSKGDPDSPFCIRKFKVLFINHHFKTLKKDWKDTVHPHYSQILYLRIHLTCENLFVTSKPVPPGLPLLFADTYRLESPCTRVPSWDWSRRPLPSCSIPHCKYMSFLRSI